ncbi:hypothetical protein LINGRAHAP2_LOCUS12787, partial [Linum grandiflorum]
HETTVAHVEHCDVLKVSDLWREATSKAVSGEDDLLDVRHHPNAVRDATTEVIKSQRDNADRGVPERLRDRRREPVVVQEQSVESFSKDLWRQASFKVVEPKVNEFDLLPTHHNLREGPHEPIITNIKLIHYRHVAKRHRNDPAKPIRVQMQQRQICQQTQLRREIPRNISMVQINPGNNIQLRVIHRRGTKHSFIRAHIRPHPRGRHVGRIRINTLLPRLQRHIGILQPGILELQTRIHIAPS